MEDEGKPQAIENFQRFSVTIKKLVNSSKPQLVVDGKIFAKYFKRRIFKRRCLSLPIWWNSKKKRVYELKSKGMKINSILIVCSFKKNSQLLCSLVSAPLGMKKISPR
jgi:hypothetical protein